MIDYENYIELKNALSKLFVYFPLETYKKQVNPISLSEIFHNMLSSFLSLLHLLPEIKRHRGKSIIEGKRVNCTPKSA